QRIPTSTLFPYTTLFRSILRSVSYTPYYQTHLGRAYLGDSLRIIRQLADDSVDLVMTSPPFGLAFKKEYGNPDSDEYVEWFLPRSEEHTSELQSRGHLVC